MELLFGDNVIQPEKIQFTILQRFFSNSNNLDMTLFVCDDTTVSANVSLFSRSEAHFSLTDLASCATKNNRVLNLIFLLDRARKMNV